MKFKHDAKASPCTYSGAEGGFIKVGRYSYVAPYADLMTYLFPVKLTIGNFCSVSANSRFFARQNHHPEWVTNYPVEFFLGQASGHGRHSEMKEIIQIGHDVWIGDSATILPGVKIGNGSVIGANAVIAKDVENFSVVVGNPARLVRYRFEEDIRTRLDEISWWDWPDDKIAENAELIWSSDITKFVMRFSK
jgi:acetyltransferase-like isoleucine patch superfamily enzyme